MNKIFFLLIFFTMNVNSDQFEDFKAEFEILKQKQNNDFKNFQQQQEEIFLLYKKELENYWINPLLSTKKRWVSYSQDKQSRSSVDFQEKKIIIEVLAKNQNEAKKKLTQQLSYAISKNTLEVIHTDELQKNLQKIKPIQQDAKPILSTILFNKTPSNNEVIEYANNAVENNNIKIYPSKLEAKKNYHITLSLPSNLTLQRAKVYENEVFHNAKRFHIPPALVFAVIQTESDFNPFAKSHIPAYGLMQIVPHSAGKDVFRFLYHKDSSPSASYLYNSRNNIETGSSYLHMLYYKYLKNIKDEESKLYCTIAAYNTGAGNIAWAFTKTYNLNKAFTYINSLEPQEVYNHLLKNLKYDEPKHYLKRVKKRIKLYKNLYSI